VLPHPGVVSGLKLRTGILIGLSTVAGVAWCAWAFLSSFSCEFTPRQQAASGTRILRTAVKSWWVTTASNECPSVARLKTDGVLDPGQPGFDPWGTEYRIDCRKDEIVVTSSGPDRQWGTGDDIAVPRDRHLPR
jgi:hypothetical protein